VIQNRLCPILGAEQTETWIECRGEGCVWWPLCRQLESVPSVLERIAMALEVLANAELEAKDAREVEIRLADRELIRRQKERL